MGRQVLAAQNGAEGFPELVLEGADGQIALVLRGVQAVAGQGPGELVGTGHGRAATGVHPRHRDHCVGQHAIGNGHIDMPPLPGALCVKQRGQDAHDSGHGTAQQIGHGQVGQGQLARRGGDLIGHTGKAAVVQVMPGLLAQ